MLQFIILVVDSTDRERLGISKEELYHMLASEVLWLGIWFCFNSYFCFAQLASSEYYFNLLCMCVFYIIQGVPEKFQCFILKISAVGEILKVNFCTVIIQTLHFDSFKSATLMLQILSQLFSFIS